MNSKDKIHIGKRDVINFLEDIPLSINIPLKKDINTQLNSSQIINEIENKSKIGKYYYLQISKYLYNLKKEKKYYYYKNDNSNILY